ALAALVAERAIERMVEQQEFHHAFAGRLDHRRVGEHLRRLAVRARTQVLDRHGAAGLRLWRTALHLDQAHAAVARDRQALVIAEARNLGAGGLGGLHQREIVRNFDELAVYLDIGHWRLLRK